MELNSQMEKSFWVRFSNLKRFIHNHSRPLDTRFQKVGSPDENDDSRYGHNLYELLHDRATDKVYECVDTTPHKAVWRDTDVYLSNTYTGTEEYQWKENGLKGTRLRFPEGLLELSSTEVSIGNKPKDVAYENNVAFLLQHENPGYLVAFDVSNPDEPQEIDHVSIWNGPNSIIVENSYAYIGCNTGRLYILDVSDPENMETLSYEDFGGQKFDIAKRDNLVAMADASGSGLHIIDVSDPLNPVSRFHESFSAGGVDIDDDYCYVTDYGASSVKVYDISDITSVTMENEFSVGAMVTNISVNDSTAYVGEYTNPELHVVDFSDVSSPSLVTTIDTEGQLTFEAPAMQIKDHLYVTTNNGILSIYDISDPSVPVLILSFDYGATINSGFVVDDKGFILISDYDANSLSIISDVLHNLIVGDLIAGRLNVTKDIMLNGVSMFSTVELTADRPSDVQDGFSILDEELGKPVWRLRSSATGWIDASGAEV